MSKWGSFDYKQFEKLAKKFDKATKEHIGERMLIRILQEAGNRALRKTKMRTPVGQYGTYQYTFKRGKRAGQTITKARKGSHGHVGGHLRRNWYLGNVKKQGQFLLIELYNNVEYAPHVEYGHRTRGGKGYVKGKYMLTVSMKEVEELLPKIADRHMQQAIIQLFEG